MQTYFKYILSLVSSNKKRGLPEAKRSRGFTLLELLVVISIATIITTALVIQQNKWDDQLALNTQVYELTLMIRQAQIYSLGVKEDRSGTGDKFNTSYGMYFSKIGSEKIIFFADRNGNSEYDSGEGIGGEIILKKRIALDRVERSCASSPCGSVKKVSITFKRPNPQANLIFRTASGTKYSGGTAQVFFISPNGSSAEIDIEANGQISIK